MPLDVPTNEELLLRNAATDAQAADNPASDARPSGPVTAPGEAVLPGNISAPEGIGPAVPLDNGDDAFTLVPAMDELGRVLSRQQAAERYAVTGENYGLFETEQRAREFQEQHTSPDAREKMRAALLLSRGISPDEIARDKAMAKRLGIPFGAVRYNRAGAQDETDARQIEQYEGLVDYASRSEAHAAIVRGDAGPLSHVAMEVAAYDAANTTTAIRARNRQAIEQAGISGEVRATRPFLSTEGQSEAWRKGDVQRRMAALGNRWAAGEDIEAEEKALAEEQALLEQQGKVATTALLDKLPGLNAAIEQGPTNIPIMLKSTTAALMAATGAFLLGGAETAATGGLAAPAVPPQVWAAARAAYLGITAKETYNVERGAEIMAMRQLRDADGNPLPRDVILAASSIYATLSAATEVGGEAVFLSMLRPLGIGAGAAKPAIKGAVERAAKDKSLWKALLDVGARIGITAGAEGVTEGAQEGQAILAESAAGAAANARGAKFDTSILTPENAKRVQESVEAGIAGGFWQGGGPVIVSGVVQGMSARAARKFADDQNRLHAAIEQTKTRQRDPEAMGEILEALSPVMQEEVTLPMDAAVELHQQGIDILTPLGISRESAEKAAALGQSVSVKLGSLHTMLDARQFQAAAEIMRRDDAAASAAESGEADATMDKMLRQALEDGAAAEDVRNGTATLTPEQKAELENVHQDFRSQMTEAIKSVPGLANQVQIQAGMEPYVDALLNLWRRRAVVAARRTGENPADIYRRTALQGAQLLKNQLRRATPEQQIEDDLAAPADTPADSGTSTPEAVAAQHLAPEAPAIQTPEQAEASADPAGPVRQAQGADTALVTSTGDTPARFEVWELADLIPSHDPSAQFARRADYPADVQERPYHSDPGEQDKVRRNAAALDPRYLVNTNPDAMSGPPVITADGIVLGGNSRTMSVQMAYGSYPERAQGYKDALAKQAAAFGLDPVQVAAMQQPVLVRVVQTPMTRLEMAQASRRYNEVTTQALQAEAEGVSKSKLLTAETMAALAERMQEYGTLREFFDAAASREFVQRLMDDGVIERTQASRLTESDGRLNAEGKTLAENALRGVIVQDYDVIRNAPDSALNKIDRAIPYLAQLKARGEGWDMSGVVTEALRILGTAKNENQDVAVFLGQGSLLQSREAVRPAVQAMALTLDRATQKEVALRFACMAHDAQQRNKGQGLLGVAEDANTPAKSFINAFLRTVAAVGGVPVTEYNPARNARHAAIAYAWKNGGRGHTVAEALNRIVKAVTDKKAAKEVREQAREIQGQLAGMDGSVIVQEPKLGSFFSYKPGQTLFQFIDAMDSLAQDVSAWRKAVDGIAEGGKPPSSPVQMLTQTPLVLHLLGEDSVTGKAAAEGGIYAAPHMFDGKHPNITPDILKQLPAALVDPIAVFDSDNPRNRAKGDVVFMLEAKDANGATVVVPVALQARTGSLKGVQVNIATSAYAKENSGKPSNSWFREQAQKNARYVNGQKMKAWQYAAGVYFPFGTISNASGNTVRTEADLVNLWQQNPTFYQIAYHGTPHRFDQFTLDHIGEGEGAQAHGWGLYFAGNREVGEGYRAKLTERRRDEYGNPPDTLTVGKQQYLNSDGEWQIWGGGEEPTIITIDNNYKEYELLNKIAEIALFRSKEERETQRKKLIDETKELLDKAQQENWPTDELSMVQYWVSELETLDVENIDYNYGLSGQLFEVDIPENDVLLDEDKKLKDQPEAVQEALRNLWTKALGYDASANTPHDMFSAYDGRRFYRELAERLGSAEAASRALNSLGVKGITYDGRQDGRCFVVFDDEAVKVLETFYQDEDRNAFGVPLSRVTRIEGDVTPADVEAALLELAGRDLPNEIEGITAQVNGNQRRKLNSQPAAKKSMENGFTRSEHRGIAAKIAEAWRWAAEAQRGGDAKSGKPDLTIRRFVSALNVNGRDVFAWITVKDSDKGARIYSVELMQNEKLRDKVGGGAGKMPTADALHRSFDEIIKRLNAPVNGAMPGQRDSLRSGSPAGARGSVTRRGGNYYIDLFKRADLSTLAHEMAHVYFLELERAVSQGVADAQMQDDFAKLRAWVGAAEGRSLTDAQHEQLARGFEAYLMEGKAPTPELEGTFARFRAWLLRIYQTVKALNVQLNDEVRGVFDRMLATQEEIEAAAAENELLNLTTGELESMGVSRVQQEYTRRVLETAKQIAAERLQSKRDAERRSRRADYTRQATEELQGNPRYLAAAAMRATPLDLDAVVDLLGGEQAAAFRKRHPASLKRGGADPTIFAAQHGYESADALLADMQNLPRKADAVRVRVEALDAEYDQQFNATDELFNSGGLQEHASLVARHLSRVAGRAYIQQRAIVRVAAQEMEQQPMREAMRVDRYRANMRRALRDERRAIAAKEFDAAYEANTKARLNLEMARASQELRDSVDAMERRVKRFMASKTVPDTPKYALNILAAQHGVMDENARLAASHTVDDIREWQTKLEADGYALALDPVVMTSTTPWREMSMREFAELLNAFNQIIVTERNQRNLLTAAGKKNLDAVAADLEQSIMEHGTLKREDVFDKKNPAKAALSSYHTSHMKIEQNCLELDGWKFGGPCWTYIYKPISDAENNQALRLREVRDYLKTHLFSMYSPVELSAMGVKKSLVPSIGKSVTMEWRIALALNMGNATNIERIKSAPMVGEGKNKKPLTDEQIADALKPLTRRDWQFVQGVWDYFETFKPESFKLQEEVTGVRPTAVEPQPFTVTTADGQQIEMRGGYYPIAYDRAFSERQFERDQKEMDKELFAGRNYGAAMTRHGHLKERAKGGMGTPLRMELGVIPEHLFNTVHDLAYRKAVLDVAKVLRHGKVRDALVDYAGRDIYRQFMPWLQDCANERQEPMGSLQRAARWARAGSTIMQMGFKVTTMVMQPIGITQTFDVLGYRWTCAGIAKVFGNAWRIGALYRETCARSQFMATRLESYDRDIRDITKSLQTGTVLNWVTTLRNKAFVPMAYFQMAVDLPTWWGAYEKGLKDFHGDESKAAQYADSIVRQAQGSGSTKDLSQIQRYGDLGRLFTMYYSYFNVFYNLLVRHIKELRADHSPAGIFRAANSALLLWFIPSVLSELAAGRGPEEDEEWWKWASRIWFQYPFQAVVGLRDIVNGIASGFDYEITPASATPESIIKATKTIYKALEKGEPSALVKPTVEAIGYGMALPLKQPVITIGNMWDYCTDPSSEFYVRDLFLTKPKERRK